MSALRGNKSVKLSKQSKTVVAYRRRHLYQESCENSRQNYNNMATIGGIRKQDLNTNTRIIGQITSRL